MSSSDSWAVEEKFHRTRFKLLLFVKFCFGTWRQLQCCYQPANICLVRYHGTHTVFNIFLVLFFPHQNLWCSADSVLDWCDDLELDTTSSETAFTLDTAASTLRKCKILLIRKNNKWLYATLSYSHTTFHLKSVWKFREACLQWLVKDGTNVWRCLGLVEYQALTKTSETDLHFIA